MTSIPLTEARASLPTLLDRVAAGEEITVTRHGRPVAVLVDPASLRTRRRSDTDDTVAELAHLLQRARHEPLEDASRKEAGWADDLVTDVRTSRDSR